MNIRISLIIWSGLLSILPAIFIGYWTYKHSIDSQFEEVHERHLLLARNLASGLERYYLDTKIIFEGIAQNMESGRVNSSDREVLKKLHFVNISSVEIRSARILQCLAAKKVETPEFMNPGLLETARTLAVPGKTVFSHVMKSPAGRNIMLLVRKSGDLLIIGQLKTDYFVEAGKRVAFGKKGHAAIVDHRGNVLAHPLDSWIAARKNITKVSTVQRMIAGETGIQRFYSPALKGDMIAGFTHVKGPGWGVMIPQPVQELYDNAWNTWKSSLLIIASAFAIAILLAIWLSFRSTRPINKLINAKKAQNDPSMHKPLDVPRGWVVPTEIKQLYTSHNEMLARLKNSQTNIVRMAYSDPVTSLPSREAFNRLVEKEIETYPRENTSFLFILIDLDDFKAINDTLGHDAGDIILKNCGQKAAAAIKQVCGIDTVCRPLNESNHPIEKLRGRAIISRIGGDEFMIFMPWNDADDTIPELLRTIQKKLAEPVMAGAIKTSTKISMGASIFARHGLTIRDLSKKADLAMYQAKRSGKGTFHIYDESAGELTPAEMQRAVTNALKNHEMRLFYQPKLDLENARVEGVEAVIRWQHPTKGLLGPGNFIPIVENSVAIDTLGEWVIETAAKQISLWQKSGRDMKVAVNIANHHLVSENFLPHLLATIEQYKIAPALLEVEITEQTAMSADNRARNIIRALKENGISVSLDDYGKGYSNLARLASLEIDVVKLDMSLVQGIIEDDRKTIIVASAVSMAEQLGCKTVAEGIETAEQATYLARLGCNYLQGFYFAKPLPAAELDIWLLKNFTQITSRESLMAIGIDEEKRFAAE